MCHKGAVDIPSREHSEPQDNVEWGVDLQGNESIRKKSTQPILFKLPLYLALVTGYGHALPSLTYALDWPSTMPWWCPLKRCNVPCPNLFSIPLSLPSVQLCWTLAEMPHPSTTCSLGLWIIVNTMGFRWEPADARWGAPQEDFLQDLADIPDLRGSPPRLLVVFFPLPPKRNVLLLTTSDGWMWGWGHFCSWQPHYVVIRSRHCPGCHDNQQWFKASLKGLYLWQIISL